MQRLNLGGRQALRLGIGAKLPAIVAKEAVRGTHPEKSGTVFQEAVDVQVGQPLILSVLPKTVALTRQGPCQEQEQHGNAVDWTHH